MQSPAVYCAPERVHDTNPSFASDMWSFMCIFAELYSRCPLFKDGSNASVVPSMVGLLGPLPTSWKACYKAGGLCNPAWYDQNRQPDPEMALKARLARLHPATSQFERELVESILRRGLSYHPEGRLTAKQLAEDASWMNIMRLHGL